MSESFFLIITAHIIEFAEVEFEKQKHKFNNKIEEMKIASELWNKCGGLLVPLRVKIIFKKKKSIRLRTNMLFFDLLTYSLSEMQTESLNFIVVQ